MTTHVSARRLPSMPIVSSSSSSISRMGLIVAQLEDNGDTTNIDYTFNESVTCVRWNPHRFNRNDLLVCSGTKILLWNLIGIPSQPIRTFQKNRDGITTYASWSLVEPSLFAVCSSDSYIHFWDMRVATAPVISMMSRNGT